MNDPTEIEQRLRALGDEPIDPALASQHLTAIATAAPARRAPRWHRTKVAAAFGAGLLLGGTSLASAGVLGETPQNVVADTADNLGLNLPGGTPRSTEGCDGVEYKNHGQFVKAGGDPHSACGKPLNSVKPKEKDDKSPNTTGVTGAVAGVSGANEGCGPPPWAHGNHAAKTPEAVAAFHAQCPDEHDDSTGVTGATGATGATGRGASTSATNPGCGPPPWAHGNHAARTPEAVAAYQAQCPDAEDDETEAEEEEVTPTSTTEAPPTTLTGS